MPPNRFENIPPYAFPMGAQTYFAYEYLREREYEEINWELFLMDDSIEKNVIRLSDKGTINHEKIITLVDNSLESFFSKHNQCTIGDDNVISFIPEPLEENLIRCSLCKREWNGCAQCMCILDNYN